MNAQIHPVRTSWHFLRKFKAPLSGNACHAVFSSGIEMVSMDFTANADLEQSFSIGQAPIIFSFHLSGFGQGKVTQSPNRSLPMTREPGKASISFNPGSRFKSKVFDHQHYRALNIYISPRRLCEKLDSEMDQVPAGLRPILDNAAQLPYNQELRMQPQVRMIVDQIFNCPYKGAIKKLYLESKCVELIINELLAAGQGPKKNSRNRELNPRDRDLVHRAKRILLRDLGAPPALHDLARQTGLNENKLSRGFKQEFGMTVYQFYQMHRINRSKEILDEGRLNIDETAHSLGYFDTTHFIKHFKHCFGTTPGTYLKTGQTRALTH